MRFQTKLFFGMMAVGLAISLTFSALFYIFSKRRLEAEFVASYSSKLELISAAFSQLEKSADLVGMNAALGISEVLSREGVPSNAQLARLSRRFNVSNAFLTDARGRFIRSTNGDVGSFKNSIFDYCSDYRQLIEGQAASFQTPVIPSSDEVIAGPFKYIMIPNFDRSGVIEVSIHLNFIKSLLEKSILSDKNILSVGFYTSSGDSLGLISKSGKAVQKLIGREITEGVRYGKGYLSVTRHLNAQVEKCCECKVKGLTEAGGSDFFYVLRATVTAAPLEVALGGLRSKAVTALILASIFCFLFSRLASARLLKRLNQFNSKVDQIRIHRDLGLRTQIEGADEIASLSEAFDRMTESLEEAQAKLIEAEAGRATADLAKQIAHDIRSPLGALRSIGLSSEAMDGESKHIFAAAVERIGRIADSVLVRGLPPEDHVNLVNAADVVLELIQEKQAELLSRPGAGITIEVRADRTGGWVQAESVELARVISNLLNNSIEAMSFRGVVVVRVVSDSSNVIIEVIDEGRGIPTDLLEKVGTMGFSYGKANGFGIGLASAKAAVARWGGSLDVISEIGVGTTVRITLPLVVAAATTNGARFDLEEPAASPNH